LGDAEALDLAAFHADYCDLLHEVWDDVPVIWENGHAVAAEPPANHACAR